MRNDNENLSDILQHEYSKKTGYYTYTEVPEKGVFEIDGYELKIKYPADLVSEGLNNCDSFEGWIMVCRRWGIFDKIKFEWTEPKDINEKIYQEFLYRIKHFNKIFSGWFEISKDSQTKLTQLHNDVYVCDKRILESIIDIAWLFETGKKIEIDIPDNWNIHFEHGIVEIQPELEKFGVQEALDETESQIYSPWQLLINRWAYLPTSPKSMQQNLPVWDSMTEDVKELIKVGFSERNIPFPAEY